MTTHAKRRMLSSLIMGTLMSAVMSFSLTAFAVGFSPEFVEVWLPQFARAWLIAVPLVLLLTPFIQRVVLLLVPDRPHSSEHPYD